MPLNFHEKKKSHHSCPITLKYEFNTIVLEYFLLLSYYYSVIISSPKQYPRYILTSAINCLLCFYLAIQKQFRWEKATMHVKHENIKKLNTSSLNLSMNLHLVKNLRHGNPISQVLNISARCGSMECLQLKEGKTLCFSLSRQVQEISCHFPFPL